VRIGAIIALEKLEDPRAVPPLINSLGTKPVYLSPIIRVLSKLKDPRALEPLLAFIYHKDPAVRRDVVDALGEIGDKRAVMPLIDFVIGSCFFG
jgi:HEAT repeat protein